jgi:hypothetical protein
MRKPLFVFIVALLVCLPSRAEQPASGANTDATYRQLRDISIGSEAISVSNFTLERDAAKFKFHQGTFTFVAPVNGKVTGAVFNGDGVFIMTPPIASEARPHGLPVDQAKRERSGRDLPHRRAPLHRRHL